MVERHSFIFPLSSLKEKVEKHTSVLGKHRKGEDSEHLLDRYSLTEGEDFMFDDYLKEAVAKTYNWIKAFGRNLSDGCRVFHNAVPRLVRKNDEMSITLNGFGQDFPKAFIPLTNDMYAVEQVDSDFAITLNLPHLCVHKGNADSFSFNICIKYVTLADGIFVDNCEYNEIMYSHDDIDITEFVAYVTHRQDDMPTVIQRVNSVELSILSAPHTNRDVYNTGEVIEYVDENGIHKFGIQKRTSTELVIDEWYDENLTDCVVFKVELPEWQDRNMLPAAEDHLEEALANYIMYRWFETVQDDIATKIGGQWRKPASLADGCFAKWEEHARAAQLALNSERKILQRKSTWLQ